MPDVHGHLSPVEIAAVHAWIRHHHGGLPFDCPVSGPTTWVVNEYVYQSIIYPVQAPITMSVSPMAWPVVQVVCTVCGYTMYFNAGLIGLYPSQPTPPPRFPTIHEG